ncbi:MAG: substrate-binding domain-containing protein [Thaumarchaeota archaeon]|nr:substrate-binding domain-containing protein [Nitrososphaerota archaeon]
MPVAPVKSGGSTADAAAIAAGAPDDVFVSSSLPATSSQYLANATSNWAVGFATDQMVLAYANSTQQTAATNTIIGLANTAIKSNATSDWNAFYAALVAGNVKVGISAPAQDPAGARAWIVLQAAGYLYSGGNAQAYVSTLLSDKANVTASSAANLVAPLQAGNIQFLFTYKSAAIGNQLNYITLNSRVNLGTASLASFYSKFSYTSSAGVTKGATIIICVTIPLSAVNTAEALQFVQYLVQNAKSLSTFGLVPIAPCLLYENSPPPAAIQQLITQGLIVNNGALP